MPMSAKADNIEFTDQQRHDIIMEQLSEFGKGAQCFQLRWREDSGQLLTGDILLQTPMFWYMRYKWSRQEIEILFYKARVVMTDTFDRALDQTFGGDKGPRWKGGGGIKKKKKKQQQYIVRDWSDTEKSKSIKEDDSMNYHINHPNFEYHPVVQPVHFQAMGGIDSKNNNKNGKQRGSKKWEQNKQNEVAIDLEKEDNHHSKLLGFLDAICDEIKEDQSHNHYDDDNVNLDEDEDAAINAFFSQSDLDDIQKETQLVGDGLAVKKKRNSKKHKKRTSSIGVTITTGKIKRNNHRLKRMSGGLNIVNKGMTLHLRRRSDTLRREKAEIQAIEDAKRNKSSTNVTKRKF